jgi:tetratricopeptide (TPR) repeat protein
MNKAIIIISYSILFGQITVMPQGRNLIQNALLMERKGDIERARTLYEDMLRDNPGNRQAYQRLKEILKRTGELDSAIQLVEVWIDLNPNDLQAYIELGEIVFLKKDKIRATKIWNDFEITYGTNKSIYRMLVHTFSRLGLTEEIERLVKRGRSKLGQKDMLALDLANYYYSRQTYDRALDEYLIYIIEHPQQEKLVTDRVLLMSDDPENHLLIEKKLISSLDKNHLIINKLLAGYYFKTSRYNEALNTHRSMGLDNNSDFNRWLLLAGNLRKENQYDLSIKAYQELLDLELEIPPKIIGEALLGLGKTYEDQLLPNVRNNSLVVFYPDNLFFKNEFFQISSRSRESLEKTFELYKRVLQELPASSFSPKAHFRLGEIQFKITRDFDGARTSYLSALASRPDNNLRQNILLRIGDTFMAEGNLIAARNHFKVQHRNNNTSISPFTMKEIHLTFLTGAIDTAKTVLDSVIVNSLPNDKYFNDLMELQDIIAQHYTLGNEEDKEALLQYSIAERFLQQYKLVEAAEMLAFIRENYPDVSILPTVMLRECLLRLLLEDVNISLNISQLLEKTIFASQGITIQGEINEQFFGDIDEAMKFYNNLLESYPMSMLAEPVRMRMRQLKNTEES